MFSTLLRSFNILGYYLPTLVIKLKYSPKNINNTNAKYLARNTYKLYKISPNYKNFRRLRDTNKQQMMKPSKKRLIKIQ